MRYTQSNIEISNSQTISDGVILDGTNIKLTNTRLGRIVGGLQFAQAGNTLINETSGVVRGADGSPATAVSVTGSAGTDTIINSGSILGKIDLGAGSDTFVQRNGAHSGLDLGADNDLLRFESGGLNFAANGGAGYDTVVLASGFSPTLGTDIVGFERLVVESDIVVTDYSGYQAIEFANPGNTIYVSDSQNPLVDLRLENQGVDLSNQSTLRSITGGNSGETVGLSSGSVVSDLISLGGGADIFDLFYRPDLPDGSFSRVDGGDGFDRVEMGVRGPISRQLDLSGITNFDQLDIYTQDAPSTVTLAGLSGFRRVDLNGAINLTLDDSQLSGAVFSISLADGEASAPLGVTLGSGTVIGSFVAEAYQDAQSEYPSAGAGSGVLLVNNGLIEGDVRLNIGEDRYDGRSGIVGGTVYGNAGNDVLLGGSGSDSLFGDAGNDTLFGGAGDDLLGTVSGAWSIKPGSGHDTIDGGTGTDTLQLGGAKSDYQLLTSGSKSYFVSAGGATEVVNVEAVKLGFTAPASISTNLAGVKAFDGLSYIAGYSDLRSVFGTNADRGVEHFVNAGFNEGRAVLFNGLDYIASYADLRGALGTDAAAGARHFIQYGAGEGRASTFNGWNYLASYSDLIRAFGPDEGAAARHYIQTGANEGRGSTFNATSYGKANPDLVNVFGNDADALARHYVTYGYAEGRSLGPRAAAGATLQDSGVFAEEVAQSGLSHVENGAFAPHNAAGLIDGGVHDFAISSMIPQHMETLAVL